MSLQHSRGGMKRGSETGIGVGARSETRLQRAMAQPQARQLVKMVPGRYRPLGCSALLGAAHHPARQLGRLAKRCGGTGQPARTTAWRVSQAACNQQPPHDSLARMLFCATKHTSPSGTSRSAGGMGGDAVRSCCRNSIAAVAGHACTC